jgi:hypothetical protein
MRGQKVGKRMVQREMNTGEEKKWEGEREKDEIAKRLRLRERVVL